METCEYSWVVVDYYLAAGWTEWAEVETCGYCVGSKVSGYMVSKVEGSV